MNGFAFEFCHICIVLTRLKPMQMKRTAAFLFMLVLAFPSSLYAQEKVNVTGIVLDSEGTPLIGATVMVAGTTNGVLTGIDGKYSISVFKSDKLQAACMGYESVTESVGDRTSINFKLNEDVSLLDEVVVIGYGQAKKSDLTGSVSTVKMSDLKVLAGTSVDNALQGKIAGADIMSTSGAPGATTTIRIRGTRSINASNEPLYVVDGVTDAIQDINDINPDDIESISVLKDASSTAIYGSRGSNGVILITTKQGTGNASKPNITFSADFGISQLPSSLDIMNASEFAQYRNDLTQNGNNASQSGASTETPMSELPYSNPLNKTGTDWIREILRTGSYKNYAISMSGAEKGSNYLASLSYNDTQGIIQDSGQQKFTARLKLNKRFNKYVRVGFNGFYMFRDNHPAKADIGGTSVSSAAQYLSPFIAPADNYNPLYEDGARINNPRALIDNTTYDRKYSTISVSGVLELNPVKNMVVKSIFSFADFQRHDFKYISSEMPKKGENDGGEAYRCEYDQKTMSNESTVTYTWKEGNHKIVPLLGFSAYNKHSDTFSLKGSGYTDDAVLWNNMAAVLDKDTYNATTAYSEINKMSAFARIDYSYNSKYYLTMTGRYDGASNFAQNNKWAFFPSAAFRWNMKKEPWMKKISWISDFSLRLSAGRSGNDAISAYQSISTLNTSSGGYLFDGSQPASLYRANIASPDLTWEKTDAYNVALDVSLFKKRLNVTAEGYYSRTSDLLLSVQMPSQVGFTSRLTNLGLTSNKGVELSIESVNVSRRKFQWLSSFTISHNVQMVEDIGTEDFVSCYNAPSSKYMMYGYVKGYPLNSLWGFKYAGVWHNTDEIERNEYTHTYLSILKNPGQAKFYDINYDGVLNEKDLVYLGNADPWLYGGLQNTFHFKDIKLGVYFVYSLGGKIYNYSEFYMAGGSYTNQYRYMLNAWHPVRNPDSDIPAAGYKMGAAYPSSFMVHDASYLRLKTLSLSYTIHPGRRGINFIKDITVGVSGDNLWLLKKYNGFDPDVNSSEESSTLRRVDLGTYPKARSIMFNFNIRF